MALDIKTLWPRIRGLVFFGWAVALIRFILEFTAPDYAMYIGVYFVMPVAYLYYGVTGRLDDLSWPRLALAMVMVAFFVWFIPNAISYTTAQFMGWQHGRFSADIAASAGGKILSGLGVAVVTFVGGALWSVVFGTLLTWLPGHRRRKKLMAA